MPNRNPLMPFERRLKAAHKTFCLALLFISSAAFPACAQNPQFLPEIDAHLKLNSNFRTYLEAKDDRDGGDPTQFTIGPSIQFYLKPLLKLKELTVFDLDDSKSRALVLEAGYRAIMAPNTALENRELVAATFNFPLRAGFSPGVIEIN
jgi:hypothetical protein